MENLPVYKLVIDDNEELGVEFVALVDQPAIETNWHAFKDHNFESYDDYPKAASENAKIALRWAEENGWGDCGTPVGKARANQLAKGEPISRETIARMAGFERHRQNSQKALGDGCGRLMWLAWGGDAGIEWAQRKLEQIDKQEMSDNYGGEGSGCSGDNCGRPELNAQDIEEINVNNIKVAESLGLKKEDYKIEYGKTPGNLTAHVAFVKQPDGKYIMDSKITIKKQGDKQHIKKTLEHELRHLWQSKTKGFYITNEGMHWEGNLHITTKEYNKILNGMSKAKTKDDFNKWKKKYVELPWEKDADDFAGITHKFILENLDYNEKPVDIIQLPKEIIEQEMVVNPRSGESKDEFVSRCISVEVGNGIEQDQAAAICYSKWENKNMNTQFKFFANKEKRMISGALMIADLPIYRKDESGEYYVVFDKEQIEKIAQRFFKKGYTHNVNMMHDAERQVNGVYMVESFIIDKERGIKTPEGYPTLTEGSWFGTFKVDNNEVWNDFIKTGVFKGFSVEGAFSQRKLKDAPVSIIESLADRIHNLRKKVAEIATK